MVLFEAAATIPWTRRKLLRWKRKRRWPRPRLRMHPPCLMGRAGVPVSLRRRRRATVSRGQLVGTGRATDGAPTQRPIRHRGSNGGPPGRPMGGMGGRRRSRGREGAIPESGVLFSEKSNDVQLGAGKGVGRRRPTPRPWLSPSRWLNQYRQALRRFRCFLSRLLS